MLKSRNFLNEIAAELRVAAQTSGTPPHDFSLPKSAQLIAAIESGQALVGELPPEPPTIRGRLCKTLVSLVRRSLFWYTPPIQAFQRAVAAAFREQGETIAMVVQQQHQSFLQLNERLALIEKTGERVQQELLDQIQADIDALSRKVDELHPT